MKLKKSDILIKNRIKNSTCSILEQVQLEGNRKVSRKKDYYNLDMIISIGFRVNSKTAIKFRTWANNTKRRTVQNFERFYRVDKARIEMKRDMD